MFLVFFFSSRRRHTRWPRDWSSDVCSSDLLGYHVDGQTISVPGLGSAPTREVVAHTFPISIDSAAVSALTEDPDVRERAQQLRQDLGNQIGRASCRERV